MTLPKRDLLQLNATIIAGLLILLTIQTAILPLNVFDIHLLNQDKIDKLETLIKISNDTRLKEKANERINELIVFDIELLVDAQDSLHSLRIVLIELAMILFIVGIIPFAASCIKEIRDDVKSGWESSSEVGRWMTYAGFVFLFTGSFLLVIFRLILN